MAVLYQTVVNSALYALNDAAQVRYGNTELVVYLCDGLVHLQLLRPNLFRTVGAIPNVAGTCFQTVPFPANLLLDIYGIQSASGPIPIRYSDFRALRTFRPTYALDAAGPAVNWFRYPEDTADQFRGDYGIYPQAPANQSLVAEYSSAPLPILASAAGTTNLPCPDTYQIALQAYVIFRAESKDDEHVTSQRAQTFEQMFETLIKQAEVAAQAGV